ncbi:MAG TPA: hypothetical protein DD414_03415 [Lachnospiraceae bacterium]|nr:hypothetical protein [Lachnospiraceae bacterium]
MNILYLNTTYRCGGAEKVVSQLFWGMRQRGHKVYEIVCYDMNRCALPEGVQVLYPSLPMRIFNRLITGNHGNQSLRIGYSRRRILSFIKKYQIDLVHLNNAHGNFLGIQDIAMIAKACPVVWTLHDFWAMTGHCSFPYGCTDRWKKDCSACPRLDNYPALRKDVSHRLWESKKEAFRRYPICFTVPSEWMREQFEASYLKGLPCRLIYNSLDLSVWKPLDKQKIRARYGLEGSKNIIGFIAADPQKKLKGMELLLEALSHIPNARNYLLLVAGREGSLLERLNGTFETRCLGYLDSQKALNEFYAASDLLVNPSLYETFGLTNIEALACQTPVAAFPVCTMPEILESSCGWIAPEVSAGALADTIVRAFSDKSVLEEKGRAGRRRVEEVFSEEKMLDAFEDLYRTTLEKQIYSK